MNKVDQVIDDLVLGEAFKSSIMGKIQSASAKGGYEIKNVFTKITGYGISPKLWNQIENEDFETLDPATVKPSDVKGKIVFWIAEKEKQTPTYYHNKYSSTVSANTLVAVTDGVTVLSHSGRSRYTSTKYTNKLAGVDSPHVSSMKKIAQLSDVAYAIDKEALKKYQAEPLRTARATARQGATALMSDKDFRAQNQARYRDLLAKKTAAEVDVVELMKEIVDIANQKYSEALAKMKAGEIPGKMRNMWGNSVAREISREMAEAWENLENYLKYKQSREKYAAEHPEDHEMDKYAFAHEKEYLLKLRSILNDFKSGKYVEAPPEPEEPEEATPEAAPETAPTPETEALQIIPRADLLEVELRRSDKPLKAHGELADKFLEARSAIDDLKAQANAITAVVAEKERIAGNMAGELKGYAEEYKDRVFKTNRILIKLEDVPAHKSQTPQWKRVMEYMLNKLEGISKDMRKEAEAFVEDAKQELPGHTDLLYQKLESKQVIDEKASVWQKIVSAVKAVGNHISGELEALEDDVQDFLVMIGT